MTDKKESILSIRFPPEVIEQMRAAAENQGLSVSQWLRSTVDSYIERALQPMDTISRLNRALDAFAPFVILLDNNDPHSQWTKKLHYAYEDLLEMLREVKNSDQGQGVEQPQGG